MCCHTIHLASVTIRWYSNLLAKSHTRFLHLLVSTFSYSLVTLATTPSIITATTNNTIIKQQIPSLKMRAIPIRELSRTETSHRLNENLSLEPNNNTAQAPTVPSHDALPSPVHSEHTCISDNGTSAHSPPRTHLSSSLEALEAPVDDHMDWTPPSPILSTPNVSDNSASSSDSDTPLPSEHPIKLSDFLPLPTSSPGYLTHAHQQAMAHRITYDKITPGGSFDPSLYTPVFLHDTLTLPGSLATLLGKVRFHHHSHPIPPNPHPATILTNPRTPPSTSSTV